MLQRPFQIKLSNFSAKSYISFIEVNSSISTSGSISFYVNILQDLPNMNSENKIMLETSSGEYDLAMVNKTINVCKLFTDRKYEPMIQVLYKLLTKTSNFPNSCPIRKVISAKYHEISLFISNLQNFFRNCILSKTIPWILKICHQYFRVGRRISL